MQTASHEIQTGSNDLSARTEQACSALEETARAASRVLAAGEHARALAADTDAMTRNATEAAHQGQAVVAALAQSMATIRQQSQEIAEIVAVVEAAGGRAILTDPDLPSGSDRIRAAVDAIDPEGDFDAVINVQGDMPFADPGLATACAAVLHGEPACDIATLVAAEADPSDRANPDVVKAVLALKSNEWGEAERQGRALYFTRSTLYGDAPIWRHIGVYGYRRAALNRFCAAPQSPLEKREKLEQLRALEMGMQIWAAVIDEAPLSVDNPADLEAARALV
jgi:3-deoxy-manno-octulosonate cytidylyltransferase (CMP-KDO synthetase)